MGRTKGASPQKRKKVKDPNKPKRSTSAYFFFLAHCRQRAQKEGKSTSKIAEFTKECSAEWKALTESAKKPFNEKAAQDKARYDKEMAAYKGEDDGKPKRPQSAYFLFLADHRVACKGKDIGHKDILKQAGEKWKKLSDTDRKPYDKAAQEEQKKYEKAMEEWRKSGGGSAAKKMKQSNGKSKAVVEDDDDEDDEDDVEDVEDDDDEEEEDEDDDDDE